MDGPLHEMREKLRRKLRLHLIPPGPRRLVVGIVGGLLFMAGLAMIVLPGPAFIVIPLSLALLATEFQWAERYLAKGIAWFNATREKLARRKRAT